MALLYVPGMGVVDDQTTAIPEYGELVLPDQSKITWGTPGIERVPEYNLSYQFGGPVQWRGEMGGATPAGMDIAPGYVNQLLQWADAAERGQLQPYEQEQWQQLRQQALAVPTRDVQGLRFDYGVDPAEAGTDLVGFGSPDLGALLLGMRARLAAGTATPHERALFEDIRRAGDDWNSRASVPQASDAFNPLGDQLFGALAVLGTGATAGLAAAPLAAGGAGLATTLGSLGTLAGTAGGWASTIGGATGQDWLQKLGMGLGLAGGLAGAAGGMGSALGSGLRTVGDVGRLASGTSKLLRTVGSAANQPGLTQAASYLNLAGTLGRAGGGAAGLLGAADVATQRGGGPMAWDDWGSTDWLDWSGGGQGLLLSDAAPGIDWGALSEGGPGSWAGQMLTDWGGGGGGGTHWLSTLGSLAGGAGTFLGSNSSWLGPAVSGLAGLGTGLLGRNASSDAAAAQAAALNRGIDLQTAQWLTQQQHQAPWLQHGQEALAHLGGIANMGAPAAFQPGATLSGLGYALPGTTPGWTPQTYGGYTPVGVPTAADYLYTPGQYLQPGAMPDTGFQYTNQLPTEGFEAPTFEQLKARDPGIQARLDEARNALEASAAARGGLTSGATLGALQRQAQTLASQEYAPAYQRALGEYQMGYGQDWQRQQEAYQRALAQNELRYGRGWQQYLQGWQQGLTREQLAQQASAQNWGQALAEQQARSREQQFGWQAGLTSQQWNQEQQQKWQQEQYQRQMEQAKLRYGQDWAQNVEQYQRDLAAYNSQLAAQNTLFNRWSSLAGLGQTATNQLGAGGQAATNQLASLLGQLGSSQAVGQLGSAYNLNQGLGALGTGLTNLLKGLNV